MPKFIYTNNFIWPVLYPNSNIKNLLCFLIRMKINTVIFHNQIGFTIMILFNIPVLRMSRCVHVAAKAMSSIVVRP